MAIQKTEAFVLKTFPFRTSSLIVTFYSRVFGKMKGIAKGVRLERETRGALFELFTHLDIVFYEKQRSDLHLVSEASILDSHDALRTRLDTIAYASYFSELVDVLTEVHDPHDPIYHLLSSAFRFLPSIPGERISRLFEIKLLTEVGWLPHLDDCLECRDTRFESGFFSVSQGAFLCPRCASKFQDARPLTAAVLAVLRYFASHEFEESLKQPMNHRTESDLAQFTGRFMDYRMPHRLKTRNFLEVVKPLL